MYIFTTIRTNLNEMFDIMPKSIRRFCPSKRKKETVEKKNEIIVQYKLSINWFQ